MKSIFFMASVFLTVLFIGCSGPTDPTPQNVHDPWEGAEEFQTQDDPKDDEVVQNV